MPRHTARRPPRAHWLLLLLALATLMSALVFQGYTRHLVGKASTRPLTGGAPAPDPVLHGGPVLRAGPGGRVDSSRPPANTIALTFDDGPDPVWTPRVLDVLRRHHAHATFFMVGSRVNEHPELVRAVLRDGDEVGSHTFTHADLGRLPGWRYRAELELTQNALAGAASVRTALVRPPYSSGPDALSGREWGAVRRLAGGGYLVVLSDRDSEDWRRPGVDRIVANATPAPGQGAIVLMHDGGGDRTQTVRAVDELLTRLEGQGYRFTTVSRALAITGADRHVATTDHLRGVSLRWAQRGAELTADLMTGALLVAGGLTGLRLVVQLGAAWLHVRIARRRRRRWHWWDEPVTVIVPAYNEAAGIADTVYSLVDTDHPWVEVIVVDDGSSDGTADIAESLGLPNVLVVRKANGGKPSALNLGLRYARTELIVMVDGDTVFERDTIPRLVRPFQDPRIGAVSGNTKVGNRRRLLGRWQHLEYVVGFNLDRRLFDLGRCMPTVPGAIGAFRRPALIEVGGVSDDTLAEDTDLTMALCRAGWRVVYEETARAWTEVPSGLRQLWKQRYRWSFGTMQAIWKHRRALRERGAAGRLGRRGLAYLVLFQVLLPLFAPVVDIFSLYGLFFLNPVLIGALWLGFLGAQALSSAYALRLDGERLRVLWTLPLMQLVYRPLLCLVVVQSTVTALVGAGLRWGRLQRHGQASATLARAEGGAHG